MAPPRILLSHPLMEVRGNPTANAYWYQFSATIAGVRFEQLGGQDVKLFIEQIESALSNTGSTPLRENSAFANEINDDYASYLGCAVLSGYNAFYFFRHYDGALHLILADNTGKVLAHTDAPAELGLTWLQSIGHWRKENVL